MDVDPAGVEPDCAALSSASSTPVCDALDKFSGAGNWPEVFVLLVRGADVNARFGPCQDTLLHRAVEQGQYYPVVGLIAWGADKTAADSLGRTPAVFAFYSSCTTRMSPENPEAYRLFIDAPKHSEALGSDVIDLIACRVDANSWTDAFIALEQGMDIDFAFPPFQRTLLHQAAILDNVVVIEALIARGADCNARDYCGRTPAFMSRTLAALQLMHKRGDAHLNVRTTADSNNKLVRNAEGVPFDPWFTRKGESLLGAKASMCGNGYRSDRPGLHDTTEAMVQYLCAQPGMAAEILDVHRNYDLYGWWPMQAAIDVIQNAAYRLL